MHKDMAFRQMVLKRREKRPDLSVLHDSDLYARRDELAAHRRETMAVGRATYGAWFVKHIQDELAEYGRQMAAVDAEIARRVQ